jgi:tRNASer (uridine44-2'-O)-methyltransferase
MLRIPSTRNTGLLGRRKRHPGIDPVDFQAVIAKYGGSEGFAQSALALAKSSPRGH